MPLSSLSSHRRWSLEVTVCLSGKSLIIKPSVLSMGRAGPLQWTGGIAEFPYKLAAVGGLGHFCRDSRFLALPLRVGGRRRRGAKSLGGRRMAEKSRNAIMEGSRHEGDGGMEEDKGGLEEGEA
ncbi:hypothetical protein OPV22_019701 [Ensete ventricosum]|uniref:Uncharacterized protein n=1 Tax=Ensete ventricosum TaxID=4639 RepID=A0AAV8QN46_ENSVE|nr:hypothetical protein OPV22_019701 [Ensete ventricosum]